ncbi:MAG: hypothetical protein K2L02_05670 [Clostridia bacterium]|nr:hypothetical protein [Clostridia bacterium]
MITLLHSTNAYLAMKRDVSPSTLIVFPDAKYLRTLLKECAKAFFGEDDKRRCALIEEETFSDCIILPKAGNKLTVEDASYIVDESLLHPVEEEKKLFVLDAFDTASVLVQNKLLKILEEPPQGVYFLLGTSSEGAVLPTVLSRMRKLTVPPFAEEAVLSALDRNHAGEEGLSRAAAASGGVYSLAEELLFGGDNFRIAERLFEGEGLETLSREVEKIKDRGALFAALSLTARDLLFYRTGQERFASLKGENLKRLARSYPEGALLAAARHIQNARREVEFNASLRQAFYTLGLNIQEEKTKWQKLSQ